MGVFGYIALTILGLVIIQFLMVVALAKELEEYDTGG